MDAFKSEQLITLQFYGETKPIIVKSPMGNFALITPMLRNRKKARLRKYGNRSTYIWRMAWKD
jgi:hypothetical protein